MSQIEFVDDYVMDIDTYIKELEEEYFFSLPPLKDIKSKGLDAQVWFDFVGWLKEIKNDKDISLSALFLATDLMYKYLALVKVPNSNFQTVAITCLWVSSKYEDITPPDPCDFSSTTEGKITLDDMIACEREIMNVLNFDIAFPTSIYFLKHFFARMKTSDIRGIFAPIYLILTNSLLDLNMCRYQPSLKAASVIYIARRKVAKSIHEIWDRSMVEITGHSEVDLRPVVTRLNLFFTQKMDALSKK